MAQERPIVLDHLNSSRRVIRSRILTLPGATDSGAFFATVQFERWTERGAGNTCRRSLGTVHVSLCASALSFNVFPSELHHESHMPTSTSDGVCL